MTTQLLLAAPVDHDPQAREQDVWAREQDAWARERREAVDDRAASSAASRAALTPWACGLDSSDPLAREKCRDINPELMVELL